MRERTATSSELFALSVYAYEKIRNNSNVKCIAGKGGANDLRHGIQWQNMMYSLPPPGQGNGQPDQGVRNDNGPAVYRQGF